jgi:hypothetical protein
VIFAEDISPAVATTACSLMEIGAGYHSGSAALPLFATGLDAIGLLGWRRKRKAKAVA